VAFGFGVAFRFFVGWVVFFAAVTLGTVAGVFGSKTANTSEASFWLLGLKNDCMEVCF
jgi:hypothetical protein